MSGNNSGWNRPASNQPTAKRNTKAPAQWKGIAAGLAVAVPLVALCLWMFSGSDDAPEAKSDKGRGRIKEVTPAAAPTNKVVKAEAKPRDPRVTYKPEDVYRDDRGILRYKKNGGRAFDPDAHYRKVVDLYDEEKQTFHHMSEKWINLLINFKPGSREWFDRVDFNSPEFLADFKKSLEEPIIIKEDERDFYKRRKRAMIEVKKEICDRLADGEKLGDILNETKKEIQRLNAYKKNLEEQVDEAVAKGDLSDADIDDYVKAANQMLENNGIAPIRKSRILEWHIRDAAAEATAPAAPKQEGTVKPINPKGDQKK